MTAVFIGTPLAALSVVIKIEHRGNCVYTKSVNMELFKPVYSAGNKEGANLVFAEVEYPCSPALMFHF